MKKILLIDDDERIREVTTDILNLSNYTVDYACNGKEGVARALSAPPDLILCDIVMPELDGYGVLHIIQHHPALQQKPFIFLTGKTDHSEIRKGMALGADDYIIKPFDPTELLSSIEGRLRRADLMQKNASGSLQHFNELLLSNSSEQVLDEFVKGRSMDRYKKKQRIFSEGNHPIRLYYVQKGKVKVYKINEDGKELILKIVNEGEFFGYIAMLENSLYRESADALEDCEIAAIPRNEFEDLINASPPVSHKFIRMLARDILDKEDQLLHIAYNSLRRKVADTLLAAQERFRKGLERLPISLTRETLAAMAGTATESLIRTLTEFRLEKLIDINDGQITIIQYKKLERMIN
jgi:CRP-like cAMP-binding protein/ActR/RegA family two-component response regulator